MSVFQRKLTAAEQQKTWLTDKRSRGRWGGGVWMYPVGNTCTGVQQSVSVAERSGDTLGWKLKCWPAERSRSIRFSWWRQPNDFYLFTRVSVRMRPAPWQSSWNAETCTWRLTSTKWQISENGPSLTVYADSNLLTRVSMNAARREWGATEDEAERWAAWGGGADEGEAFTGFNHSKTLNSYWVIKTFYESSCSNLQHYNSVASPK